MDRTWDSGLEEHEPLANISIRMFGKKYELQPAADLELHPSTIGESLQTQPAQFAFYATVHSMAQAKVAGLNKQLEDRRSQLDMEYRKAGELPGGIKITEDSMRRALRLHSDCLALVDKIHDAEFDTMCLSNVVRAFEHRRECLIELSKRANNTTFNDSDINVSVAARITPLSVTANGVGKHPSKK